VSDVSSQPDRDTACGAAFVAWWEETGAPARDRRWPAFAAGWDAATQAERERIRQLASDKHAVVFTWTSGHGRTTLDAVHSTPFADLLGGDHD